MLDRSPTRAAEQDSPRNRSATLLDRLTEAGYSHVEPGILQDAAPFLDLGGEAIRASLYFTSDRTGAELCLRPEYTIPVCQAYLASAAAGRIAKFSYCGSVFRCGEDGRSEFQQAGLESFARPDTAAADAETLSLALEAAEAAGVSALSVRFGDAGLLAGLLDALRLPPAWQRRLRRGLDNGEAVATILAAAQSRPGEHAGVLAALDGADEKGARALVNDLLAIAGIASVGGRSADEIAERFLAQVALRSAPPFGAEQRGVLDRFLAIAGDPDDAAIALRSLAADAELDLAAHLDLFEERTGFMAAYGVDLATVTYGAAFGRQLDYYTGFVFEARHPAIDDGVVIGGGRYDRLAQSLGSSDPVPAVGAAIWLDRLQQPPAREDGA